jgi:spore coat protein A
MWDRPVRMGQLVLGPAERADVIVDFTGLAGSALTLVNNVPAEPVSTPAPPLPAVMQFRVGRKVTRPGPRGIPARLPGRAAHLPAPSVTRYITLNEVAPQTPRWFLNLNAVHFGETFQKPRTGAVEDWVYVNLTGDTHPMHVHLVNFQVIGRTPFDADAYAKAHGGPDGVPGGINPAPFATGPMQPPTPAERGFKDTVKANPGYFTTIRAKFDLPGGANAPQTYVHHCHILEHEDNDMMQPFTVVP